MIKAEFNELARRYDQNSEERLTSFERRLANTEAQAELFEAKLQDKLIDAVSQAERNAARVRDLEKRAVVTEAHARELESDRNALTQSWSWRITAPVRWAGGLAIGGVTRLKHGANHLARIGIATLHRPVATLMRRILRRPGLSYRINQRLMRYPALHQLLLRVARRNGVIPGLPIYPAESTVHGSLADSPDLIHLTPHARRIYADLKAAIEKNKEVH